jgi:HSP20 family molecular chaperone IbpA
MSQDHSGVAVPIGRGSANGDTLANGSVHNTGTPFVHTPPIDIHEVAEGLVLEADLPGASEGQVTIQLEDNVLSLHAKVESAVPEGARVIHQEYRPGDYYRSFILSDEVERSNIAAQLKNGVLRLTLPKAERAKTRKIEIKTS